MATAESIITNAQGLAESYASTAAAAIGLAESYASAMPNLNWSSQAIPSLANLTPPLLDFTGESPEGISLEFDKPGLPTAAALLTVSDPPGMSLPGTPSAPGDVFVRPAPDVGQVGDPPGAPPFNSYALATPPTYPDLPDAPVLTTPPLPTPLSGDIPDTGDYALPIVPAIPDFPEIPGTVAIDDLFQTPRPVLNVPEFIGTPPVVNTGFNIPEAPVLAFPDAPDTAPTTLPPAPRPPIFSFNATLEGSAPPPPDEGAVQAVFGPAVQSFKQLVESEVRTWVSEYAPEYDAVMEALDARVVDTIAQEKSGADKFMFMAHGVTPLFERARMRALKTAEAQREELSRQFSKRGFPLPSGVLLSGLQQVQADAHAAAGDAALAGATEVARLEVQYLQFVMGLAAQLRGAMLPAMTAYAQVVAAVLGQASDYARGVGGYLTEVFSARVGLLRAHGEVYQAAAAGLEVQIKAALGELDFYRVQLDAVRTQQEGRRVDQALYSALVDTQRVRVQVYAEQARALEVQANLEKLKLEVFRESVQAYGVLVQAKESEANAYRSLVAGDSAQAEARVSVVTARQSAATMAKLKFDAAEAAARVALGSNDSLVRRQEARIAAFQAQVAAKQAEVDGYRAGLSADGLQIEGYGRQVEAYRAGVEGAAKRAEIESANANTVIAANRSLTEQYRALLEAYQSRIKLQELEVEVYRAAIDGDKGRVQQYAAQIQQYGAEVDREKAIQETAVSMARAKVDYNGSLTQKYAAEVSLYGAQTQAETARYQGTIAEYRARIEAYMQTLEAQRVQVNARLEAYRAEIEKARVEYDGKVRLKLAEAELIMKKADAGSSAMTGSAAAAGHIAAAAMGAVNGIASIAAEE